MLSRHDELMLRKDNLMQNLFPEEKYFYKKLKERYRTPDAGFSIVTPKELSKSFGYNEDTVVTLLRRFIDYGKIKYDFRSNRIEVE